MSPFSNCAKSAFVDEFSTSWHETVFQLPVMFIVLTDLSDGVASTSLFWQAIAVSAMNMV